MAAGLRRRLAALHTRLAGGDHRRRRRAGHPHRPRVRPQRRAHRGPLDDRDGRRDQPLVPLRPDLPGDAQPGPALRLPGSQRRRLGPLRGAGEGAHDHRLLHPRLRPRLGPAAAPPGRHALLVPRHRPVALRRRRGDGAGRHAPGRLQRARCAARLASLLSHLRPQPARDRRGGRARGDPGLRLRRARAEGGAPELRLRGPRRARELPACPHRLALQPARLLQQGARVLPQAPARRRRERDHQRGGPARAPAARRALARAGAGRQARPAGDARLPHERHLPVLRRRPAGGHLVREARHLDHGPAPVRARLQPGDRAALGGALRLGHVPDDRRGVLAAGRGAPRHQARPGRGAAPARLARRAGPAAGGGARLEGRRVRAGARPHDAEARRRRARLRRRGRADDRARAAGRGAGDALEGAVVGPGRGGRGAASRQRRRRVWGRRRAPLAAARRPGLRGDPGAVGDDERPPRRGEHAGAGGAQRRRAGRPRRGARRRADQLPRRRHPAAQDAHLGRVVRDRVARPPLLALHPQRRPRGPLAHPDRPPAALPGPRVAARLGRGPADLQAAAAREPAASPARPRSPSATSPPTRSGRSTRPTRTTCTC